MISFRHRGDFSKLDRYLKRAKETPRLDGIEGLCREGVAALAAATPVDSGVTAQSWQYRIERGRGFIRIVFYNTNIQNGAPVAILLQYGHGTRNGGWVAGRDYINPAIRPIFDRISALAEKEVKRL